MGYLLVGIVSDRREGCAGLLQEELRLNFLCKWRRLAFSSLEKNLCTAKLLKELPQPITLMDFVKSYWTKFI